jgi:hypothetical protein
MPISNHFGVISIFLIKYFLLSNCFKYLNFYSKISLQLLADNYNNNNNIVDRRRKTQDQPQPLSSLRIQWLICKARCEQQFSKMPSRLETKGFVQQEYKWKKNEKKMRGRKLDVAENFLVPNNIVHKNLEYGKCHKKKNP